MKTSIVLFIFVALFSLTGCDVVNNKSCDLSAIKIQSVVLDGDNEGVVATAVKTELFSRGATWGGENGVKVIGKVTMMANGKTPMYAVVETEHQPFAGIASSQLFQPTAAAQQLARRVANDFCRCASEGATIRKLTLKK